MRKLIKLGVVAALGATTLTAGPTASHAAIPPGGIQRWHSIFGLSTIGARWDHFSDPGAIVYWLNDVVGTTQLDCSAASDPSAVVRVDNSPNDTAVPKSFVTTLPITVFGGEHDSTWDVSGGPPAGYYWMQLNVNGIDVPGCVLPMTTFPDNDTRLIVDTISVDRLPDSSGWYRAPVTFTGFSSSEPTAVCAPKTYSGPDIADGFMQTTCSDRPWHNVGISPAYPFKYDATPPTILWQGFIEDGATYPFGGVPLQAPCATQDATSGHGSCVIVGLSYQPGTHVMTATGTDQAGNVTVETKTYTVLPPVAASPELSITGGSVLEGTKHGGKLVFTIRLSQASTSTVTVHAKSAGITADRKDFDRLEKKITFKPGETVKTVKVEIEGDKKVEPNETFSVTLSKPTGGATISPTAGSAIGTIINDD
jgi:hypothetical protein